MTECTRQLDLFSIGRRTVTATFDGARISSDSGAILLGRLERRLGLCERIAAAIGDSRDADRVEHSAADLLRQRIVQIACGYEDTADATALRHDPALQLALGRTPDDTAPLASQPTLSRFDRREARDCIRFSYELLELWIERLKARGPKAWKRILLDFDSTDFPTYGNQQLSMFHGHYGHYIYYPLLVFDGEGWPVAALLRPGRTRTSGIVSILLRVYRRLVEELPDFHLTIRADAGFSTPQLYQVCELLGVDYVIGLITHETLRKAGKALMNKARRIARRDGTAKLIGEFRLKWGRRTKRPRRIIMKAEITRLGENPRFLITNLTAPPEKVYALYTGRGRCENHIKDLKCAMFGDRMSCSRFAGNQFRLLLHTAAYILMYELRESLAETELANAQMDTLRLKLLKIGAEIRVTARRIWVRISGSHPSTALFERLALALGAPAPT